MTNYMNYPSKKTLRSAGFLFSALFSLLFGILPYLFHREIRLSIFIISFIIILLSFLTPYSLRLPYVIWIKLGTFLGKVNSNLILFVFFYFFITPFALLKKIASRNNLSELSMGMSNDYEEAIKFGATSVRIGSLFFGNRKS